MLYDFPVKLHLGLTYEQKLHFLYHISHFDGPAHMSDWSRAARFGIISAVSLLFWEILLAIFLVGTAHEIQAAVKCERQKRNFVSATNRIANLNQALALQYRLRLMVPVDQTARLAEKIKYTESLLAAEQRQLSKLARLDASAQAVQGLQRIKAIADARNQFSLLIVLAAASNLLLAAIMIVYVKSLLARLSNLEHNFENCRKKLSTGLREVGSDELRQLDRLFRQMTKAHETSKLTESSLVEGAPDVIFKLNRNGQFDEINSAALSQWGYQPEELQGRAWQGVVTPESIAPMQEFLGALSISSEPASLRVTFVRKDQTHCQSRISCCWSSEENCAFCFASDIDAEKNREDRLKVQESEYRSLMYNLPVGLLLVDENGAFQTCNKAMESLLGKLNGAPSMTLDETFASADLYSGGIMARARQEQPLRSSIRREKGEQIPCDITIQDLNQSSFLVVVADAREKIKLKNLKQDHIFTLRSNFAAPLTRVRKILQGVNPKGEKAANRRDRAVQNTDRLLRLIDELLKLEELSPGKLLGALRPVSVERLINESLAALSDYAFNQGVTVSSRIEPAIVRADAERIVQILINLLSNAIKFSHRGGTVVVSVSADEGQVEFSVTDNGRGVPEHLKEQIFETYGQGQTSDAKTGTGLGLAICKSIIEAHGGVIGVKAAAKAGSIFWFRIPRAGELE